MNDKAAEFLITLFHARTDAHIMHLQTTSFAEHMALGDFYEGIIPLADSFAEAFQGKYGIITNYPNGYKVPSDSPVDELALLSSNVKSMRKDLPEDTELQNIVDEIASLIDSTLYKLRFLK